MKFFLTILSIAMMAQASMAGSLGRVKRADEVETAFEDMFKISAELVDLSVTVLSAIAKELPETAEFAKLRQDVKEFVDFVHDLEHERENCVVKIAKALEAMFKLFAKYNDGKEDSSAEDKEFEELLEKVDGGKFKKSAQDFQDKYYNEAFLEKMESYKKENVEDWAFLKANC